MSWVLVFATNLSLSVLFFFLFSVSVASSCFSVFHFLKGRSGNHVSTPGFSLSSDLAACSSSQGWLQQCCPRAWLMFRPVCLSVCLSVCLPIGAWLASVHAYLSVYLLSVLGWPGSIVLPELTLSVPVS